MEKSLNNSEVDSNEDIKYRKKVLKLEIFSRYKKDWDELSKRFGKKRLIEIMSLATSSYTRKDYYYLVGWVVSRVKNIKKLNFINKNNFNKIKNVFDGYLKYRKNKDTYIDNLNEKTQENIEDKQKIKINKTIFDTFKKNKTKGYNFMVREKEKNKLDITDSGDVVAPGDRKVDD